MIETVAGAVCVVVLVAVLVVTGAIVWAVSSHARFTRAMEWIWRYHDWRNKR